MVVVLIGGATGVVRGIKGAKDPGRHIAGNEAEADHRIVRARTAALREGMMTITTIPKMAQIQDGSRYTTRTIAVRTGRIGIILTVDSAVRTAGSMSANIL